MKFYNVPERVINFNQNTSLSNLASLIIPVDFNVFNELKTHIQLEFLDSFIKEKSFRFRIPIKLIKGLR